MHMQPMLITNLLANQEMTPQELYLMFSLRVIFHTLLTGTMIRLAATASAVIGLTLEQQELPMQTNLQALWLQGKRVHGAAAVMTGSGCIISR